VQNETFWENDLMRPLFPTGRRAAHGVRSGVVSVDQFRVPKLALRSDETIHQHAVEIQDGQVLRDEVKIHGET
jgi:hypothetical protein